MPLPELNILLIEDSEDDVFFFKRALSRAGVTARVHVAGDGTKAIAYLTEHGRIAPDIIFLDLKMPNLNGFEVLQWFKDHPGRRADKVFVLTSSAEPQERAQAYAMGAEDYLTKPVTTDQLRKVLGPG